jgi:hypothetical protein
MVFTIAVRTNDQGAGRSRRAVLRAGAGAALAAASGFAGAGCDLLSGDPEPPPGPDPLLPLLTGTHELIARYDAALAAHPDLAATLTPVRDAHAAHAAELARLVGTPAPGPGSSAAGGSATPGGSAGPHGGSAPADARGTLTALRAAEQGARRAAGDACLAAAADRAALLGTIAAARASHVEVLR